MKKRAPLRLCFESNLIGPSSDFAMFVLPTFARTAERLALPPPEAHAWVIALATTCIAT